MKKELFFGGLAIASATVILGGSLVFKDQMKELLGDKQNDDSESNKQKIEELWFDELKNTDKYSFCWGEMKINTTHNDSAMAASGVIKYSSKELLLYNKESRKFYVMLHQLDYKYDGKLGQTLGGAMKINVPVKESGFLVEVFSRNEMPIRLDYYGNYIAVDPKTKNNSWVSMLIGEEVSSGLAHHGCAGAFQLDASIGNDLLLDGHQVSIDRKCNESIMTASYDGDFSYSCYSIDYSKAMDFLELYKEKEALLNNDNMDIFNDPEEVELFEELKDASASAVSDEIKSATPRDKALINEEPSVINEDLKKQLEQFGIDIQADLKAIE